MADFRSDNTHGASPQILAALADAMAGTTSSYGEDPWTGRVAARIAEIFEHEAAVFPVATGTAANALGLAALTPPYGAIYCHDSSHIQVDECGAPELMTGGAKLVPLTGDQGKITPEGFARELAFAGGGGVHHVVPSALSLAQSTEVGTVYTPEDVAALAEVARDHGVRLHMDGARFANALVSLGCAPADVTWRAGVDVLSFGATKNGALMAEAVVFFDPALAHDFGYRRKRGGHLVSKMRAVSAQLEAYLADDLWLANARHANAMARRLAEGLVQGVAGAVLAYPVEANEVFVRLPRPVLDGLTAAGHLFHPWDPLDERLMRLVTAFDTSAADVDGFLADAATAAGQAAE